MPFRISKSFAFEDTLTFSNSGNWIVVTPTMEFEQKVRKTSYLLCFYPISSPSFPKRKCFFCTLHLPVSRYSSRKRKLIFLQWPFHCSNTFVSSWCERKWVKIIKKGNATVFRLYIQNLISFKNRSQKRERDSFFVYTFIQMFSNKIETFILSMRRQRRSRFKFQ